VSLIGAGTTAEFARLHHSDFVPRSAHLSTISMPPFRSEAERSKPDFGLCPPHAQSSPRKTGGGDAITTLKSPNEHTDEQNDRPTLPNAARLEAVKQRFRRGSRTT